MYLSMPENKKNSILIIYTGGTIGMVQHPQTGTLAPVKFEQILDEVPELNKFNYNIKTIIFNPSLDSSNMTPRFGLKLRKPLRKIIGYSMFCDFAWYRHHGLHRFGP
jgi:L-asparaginase